MFGVDLVCGIKAVKVRAKQVSGVWIRRCRVTLAHEFEAGIAAALGPEAKQCLIGLRNGALEKVVLPIEELAALGALKAGDQAVRIERMVGVKAIGTRGKEEEPPIIAMEFDFDWDEAAWLFLGRHCNAEASVLLTKRQLTLYEAAEA